MNSITFGSQEHTAWLRKHSQPEPDDEDQAAQAEHDAARCANQQRESGADAYARAMWEDAQESGASVNWDALDAVYAEGGYRDAPGYSECRERSLR